MSEDLMLFFRRNSIFILTTDYLRRRFMNDFTVTDQAVQKLSEYLEQNSIDSALRIALMQGG